MTKRKQQHMNGLDEQFLCIMIQNAYFMFSKVNNRITCQ